MPGATRVLLSDRRAFEPQRKRTGREAGAGGRAQPEGLSSHTGDRGCSGGKAEVGMGTLSPASVSAVGTGTVGSATAPQGFVSTSTVTLSGEGCDTWAGSWCRVLAF